MDPNSLKKAYVLHSRPYKETSLIVELFTLDEGRLGVLAKGAKRRHSNLGVIAQQFTLLEVDYVGRGELQTLTHVEISQTGHYFSGTRLLSALYINELLHRLLVRYEAVPGIFMLYQNTLNSLALKNAVLTHHLRIFEKHLLAELGYGLNLTSDYQNGEAIEERGFYRYNPELGFALIGKNTGQQTVFSGVSLKALREERFSSGEQLKDAKRLLRLAFAPLLGSKPIKTRELLQGENND